MAQVLSFAPRRGRVRSTQGMPETHRDTAHIQHPSPLPLGETIAKPVIGVTKRPFWRPGPDCTTPLDPGFRRNDGVLQWSRSAGEG